MDACSQCTYMLKCVRDSHEALQLFLLDLVQRVAESSPVSVIGETIWGDEAGSVHILQVHLVIYALNIFSFAWIRIAAIPYVLLVASKHPAPHQQPRGHSRMDRCCASAAHSFFQQRALRRSCFRRRRQHQAAAICGIDLDESLSSKDCSSVLYICP